MTDLEQKYAAAVLRAERLEKALRRALEALHIYDDCMEEVSFAVGHFGPQRMGEQAHARLVEVFEKAMTAKAAMDKLDALAPSADAADGFVVVPREPTIEIQEAMVKSLHGDAVYKCVSHAATDEMENEARAMYAAMLSAANLTEAKRG